MKSLNKKIVITALVASLGLGGLFASAPTYAYGGFYPFHQFNHMYNSSLAVGGALAGLAIIGGIAATAAAASHRECVYYTHDCYTQHGVRECDTERHYSDC